jgi:hypothetical protein
MHCASRTDRIASLFAPDDNLPRCFTIPFPLVVSSIILDSAQTAVVLVPTGPPISLSYAFRIGLTPLLLSQMGGVKPLVVRLAVCRSWSTWHIVGRPKTKALSKVLPFIVISLVENPICPLHGIRILIFLRWSHHVEIVSQFTQHQDAFDCPDSPFDRPCCGLCQHSQSNSLAF